MRCSRACSIYPDKACLQARTIRCHHSRSPKQTRSSHQTTSRPLTRHSAPCLPHHQRMVPSVLLLATHIPSPSTVLSASFLKSTATVSTHHSWSTLRIGPQLDPSCRTQRPRPPCSFREFPGSVQPRNCRFDTRRNFRFIRHLNRRSISSCVVFKTPCNIPPGHRRRELGRKVRRDTPEPGPSSPPASKRGSVEPRGSSPSSLSNNLPTTRPGPRPPPSNTIDAERRMIEAREELSKVVLGFRT